MKVSNKIGWQKYEDMIQNQLNSPLMEVMYRSIQSHSYNDDELTPEEKEFLEAMEDSGVQPMVPIDDKMMEHINLSANFDCWLGHTNFDITKKVLDTIEKMEGVEILKVCSRYRFFVGIGRMFDFKDVRKQIENHLTDLGDKN